MAEPASVSDAALQAAIAVLQGNIGTLRKEVTIQLQDLCVEALLELARRRADDAAQRRAGREEAAAWHRAEAVRIREQAANYRRRGDKLSEGHLLDGAEDHENAAIVIAALGDPA